jgi:class 3 adenylate cyclase
MDIGGWLRSLGLGEYEAIFRENKIDETVLPKLTADDLKELGVRALGDRRKLLDAIAGLDAYAHPRLAAVATASTDALPRDTAERRQVTVMFSDLVGSTALSARMDPEDLREVISAYQKCVAETVRRFDGFVAKYMGDGVLVYFGYPQAHEDDAERAVRAGLELIQAVGGLKSSAPLQARFGIATGLVVVGDLIGSGEARERGILGETPNLAARLQGLAEPNTVVIAESTRKLLGNLFELQDLGAKELKGIADPVLAWVALRPSSVESRFEALRSVTTPLVGRDEELDLLLRRWEQAKRGDGCVVLISGEPGIGKSRLAETIVERLGGEPHTRLRYFCSPHHQDSALYPSIAQLERAAGFRREDTAEQRLEKLEAVLAQGTNDLSDAVPLLADVLSIPTGDRYPPLDLTPQKRKEKTLRALLAQLEGLVARQPVLMVWEDVHWSDPTTRESLDLLIDRVPTLRVLVILTFRPEFTPPWIGRPHATMLTLNRLPRRQRAEMISYVTGGKALPKEISEQIIDRTDGVPLFIEELTKTVVESGIVTEAKDHYAVAGPIASLAIPASLHSSLLARLDRLAPTREVAQIGATLGRSFSYELICAVARMPQQKLDEALAQLASAELILRRGVPPDAEYTFKHALVQDAAYSTLLRNRRQQLHARIAETLEEQFLDLVVAQPALLARHCTEAGLAEKAVVYWLKAGQQALARSATTEAAAQLRKGRDALDGLPDGPGRQQLELDLQIALGYALVSAKGHSAPEVGAAYARARALAEQADRPEYLGRAFFGQWVFHRNRGEYKLALALAERVEKIGQARNDLGLQLRGRYASGFTRLHLGDFVAARALLERGFADPAYRGGEVAFLHALLLASLALTLAYLGYIDQARSRLNDALLEARQLRRGDTLVEVLNLACAVDSFTGSPEMQRHAEELLALSTERGFPVFLAWATAHRGTSLTALGQGQEGLSLITRGMAGLRATGAVSGTSGLLMMLAWAYGRLGQPVDGLNCLAEAAQIIETTDERQPEAALHLVRGILLNATGDPSAAERSYHQAVEVAKRQSAKLLELRASISLARLWYQQDRRGEARDLLAPIYGWFTEGFDTRYLKEAKALLDELHA